MSLIKFVSVMILTTFLAAHAFADSRVAEPDPSQNETVSANSTPAGERGDGESEADAAARARCFGACSQAIMDVNLNDPRDAAKNSAVNIFGGPKGQQTLPSKSDATREGQDI